MNKQISVKLLQATPLAVAARAIRTCWDSHDKCDTVTTYPDIYNAEEDTEIETENINYWVGTHRAGQNSVNLKSVYYHSKIGDNDKELIERVGNKNKHSSTLEHIVFTFDISGISRACLMELTRHRMSSFSVKSTRYTLKEMKNEDFDFTVKDGKVTDVCISRLNNYYNLAPAFSYGKEGVLKIAENAYTIQKLLKEGTSLDSLKYMLNESYRTSLVWTINLRSLQNFLKLRTSKSALSEIRDLAYLIFKTLPEEYHYLLEDCLEDKEKVNRNVSYLTNVVHTALGKGMSLKLGNDKDVLYNLIQKLRESIIIETPIDRYDFVKNDEGKILDYAKELLGEKYGEHAFTFDVRYNMMLGNGKKQLEVVLKVNYKSEYTELDISLYYL